VLGAVGSVGVLPDFTIRVPAPETIARGNKERAQVAAYRGWLVSRDGPYRGRIMTAVSIFWLAALALTVLMVWRIARNRSAERVSRPRALADAQLVYMEEVFRIREPVRLVAKVDRVYRLPGGSLVLVELKTRRQNRPYLSDIIQLSAQRFAIEGQTDAVVEPSAFVWVPGADQRFRSHRVRLLDSAEVVILYHRRQAVLSMKVPATRARSESACRSCALRVSCCHFPYSHEADRRRGRG
jgi:hypothetical protein